jgi:hypothetical protein
MFQGLLKHGLYQDFREATRSCESPAAGEVLQDVACNISGKPFSDGR